ncbi:MAG: hypothetical protein KAI66_02320 [Lentisphaeria bacterium]|nr:hypothetical protein [Lentisphaeria bacterium]
MKVFLKRALLWIWKTVLTFALLFLASALLRSLILLPAGLDEKTALWPLAAGFMGGLLIFCLGWRFTRLYVLGHELTHWLAAKLCARRTGEFRVSAEGGSVAVENPNVFIVLAPYFVPLFALVWIGLYGVGQLFLDWDRGSPLTVFYAGVGLFYAYHTVLTAQSLWRGQQDLQLFGPLFSLSVITSANLGILLMSIMVAGRQWGRGWRVLLESLEKNWESVEALAEVARRALS